MGCSLTQEKIALYALGELDPLESGPIAEHLAACPSCRQSASDAAEMLGQLDAALHAPANLPRRILAAIEADRQSRRRQMGWYAAAAAVAASLVLAVGAWVLWQGLGKPAASPQSVELIACQVQPSPGAKFEVVGRRTIRLDSGEIFLEVQKASESLVVRTPAGDATAVGTKFSVQCGPLGETDKFQTTVTVLEGVVQLTNSLGSAVAHPGDKLLADSDSAPMKQSTPGTETPRVLTGATAPEETPSPSSHEAAPAVPPDQPSTKPPAETQVLTGPPKTSPVPRPGETPGAAPGESERPGRPMPPPATPGTIPPPPQEPGAPGAPGNPAQN